ncbi:HamA C-terminal domain-containing protein [Sorangium sp. So ce1151]|uniref:HamA C-terminal domain-containing protein n=1 Tax=Sorangium sp. So ce1151 TaxID=3133332 RepID=UPI003F60242D
MAGSAEGMEAAVTVPETSPTSVTATEPIREALTRLARGTPTDLSALLHDVETHAVVDGTNVTAHCHCLKLDGNGRPRIDALVEAVAEHVLDYAIPRSEYRDAQEESLRTGSSQKIVRLHKKAQKLFTDLEQSGEGGELLLFALAEKVLRLPQLICKMSLKTNARMHIHGADGLHAGVDPATGKLLLYWGESKIYGDFSGAVRDCLASIAPMLSDHDASKRDLQLLQRYLDVDNEELENAIKNFLDPDSEAFNSLEFRGLCLVGFDCGAYPEGPSKVTAHPLPWS